MATGVFGMVMGLTAGMLIYGAQLDRAMLENQHLEEKVQSLQQDIESLRARPEDPSRPIRELSLRFLDVKDERLRLELNRRLRSLLVEYVVGTPVTEFDPLLVARIVEERLVPVEATLWRVEVRGAYLVWETCILYLRVHQEGEFKEDPPL